MSGSGGQLAAAVEYLPIALFAVFSGAILHSAISNPFVFDPALHAIVAKNVAYGYGWAMSYHTKDLLLPITSGPGMILPCAVMVAIFGNKIWVPPLTAGLLNVTLLGLFLYRVRRLLRDRRIMLACTAGLLGIGLYFHNMWWTTFVGEMTCFLLFLIACTIAVDREIASERTRFLLLGAMAGLTILTRMLALPGFAGIALYLLVAELRTARRGATELVKLGLCGLLGVVAVVAPFRIYEAVLLWQSPDYSYADQMQFNRDLFWSNSAIGVGRLMISTAPLTDVAGNVVRNAGTLASTFASYGITATALGLCVALSLALFWRRARPRALASPLDRFIALLGVSLMVYLLWFLVLSGGAMTDRYTLHPMLLFLSLMVLLAARAFPVVGVPMLLLAAAIVAPPARATVARDILLFRAVPWHGGRSSGYNQLVLQGAEFIARGRFRFPLANCGWLETTRELEFLLPGINNFKDCYQLIEEALEPVGTAGGTGGTTAGDSLAGAADGRGDAPSGLGFRWKHPVSFTLVINKVNWALAEHYAPNRIRHEVLRQGCSPDALYETELYRIVECGFEGLERSVPLGASTPFVGTPPMWQQSIGD